MGEPEKDQIPGACKNWFSVERWVDMSNEKYGVTWATADAPLVEIGGLTANLPRSQPNPNAYLKTIEPSSKTLLLGDEQSLAHQLPGRSGRPDPVSVSLCVRTAATIRPRRRDLASRAPSRSLSCLPPAPRPAPRPCASNRPG